MPSKKDIALAAIPLDDKERWRRVFRWSNGGYHAWHNVLRKARRYAEKQLHLVCHFVRGKEAKNQDTNAYIAECRRCGRGIIVWLEMDGDKWIGRWTEMSECDA